MVGILTLPEALIVCATCSGSSVADRRRGGLLQLDGSVGRGVEVVQVQLVHVLGEPFEDLVDIGVGRCLTKWAAICSMIVSGAF